ncbi:MAG TPA: hypothetical protein VLZ81_07405 [Blastocatellia bacterium]|nr:hypothetical protein [Blastocatellia bacterium]
MNTIRIKRPQLLGRNHVAAAGPLFHGSSWRRAARSFSTVLLALSIVSIAAIPASSKDHRQFASLISRLSEPGGYFDSDNLISNETSYLHVLGKLREIGVHGGVYVGVGPDQNFSYIAKIRPRMAIIIDIRRDNLLQQLMFKSLFERAHNRIEYLCLLFGKPFPKDKGWEQRGIKDLADYIDNTASDQKLFDRTVKETAHAVQTYDSDVAANDLEVIDRIQKAFFASGLEIRYSSHFRPPRSIYPTYRDLMLERDLSGNLNSYLNSEDDFKFVKKLEEQDLIVPAVGDLAGPKAMKAIGAYIAEIKDHVSAFYTSNVEFYLSREGTFDKFAENVRALPIDDRSVIIRSYFNYYAPAHPQAIPGHFSTQLLERIGDLLKQCDAGNCGSYNDIVTKDSILLQ